MANICSMTGSGHGTAVSDSFAVSLDLRGVNNRFMDLSLRTEELSLLFMLPVLKERLLNKISRGKIECTLTIRRQASGDLVINEDRLNAIAKAAEKIKESMPYINTDLTALLSFPGVLDSGENADKELNDLIIKAFDEAVEALLQSRIREGENLKAALLTRLQSITEGLKKIGKMLPELSELERQRLLKHISDLKSADSFDPARLEQEVVIMAERDDIQEEYDRLKSHVEEVHRILSKGGVCGKRLDFMMQEFNRESNTLASKSINAEVTNSAIELKVLIEQMREQIQNIE